ncbi:MAG: DUF1932 domain-containing protein [Nitrospinae bacterium]|nr:DUF1932 domain-containing protein [Nitrospinota bacterium]
MTPENPPTVCILGFGMAGRPIARGLADAGAAQVRVWKRPPWRSEHLDAAAHPAILMTKSMEEALEGADFVLSLVTPESALEAARTASPFIRDAVYLDLNTTTPEAKKEIGRAIEAGGGRPVDGAICDPAEVYGHKVVTLISGPEAQSLSDAMARYGMQLQVLSERVGDASALKVVRSVFTKGLMMTFFEAIEAARRCGLVEELLESIAGTVEGLPLRDLALSLAGTSLIVAERRAQEMEGVVTTLESLGVDSHISAASLEKFRWLKGFDFHEELGGVPPESVEAMISALGKIFDSSPKSTS